MKEQMEMFEEGGLADEGGTKDPVSGNDVPVGSTQKEVRDDIPAQLSEGEFVLPADVVRFHGLEKIMALRDEAKRGLAKMEAMGQMSNADEATLDDDVPFSIEDLDMEEDNDYNFNQGGVVQPQGFTGIQTSQPSQFQNYQGQYVQYQQPSIPQAASQQYTQPSYTPPQQQVVPTMQQQQLPQFEDFISTPTGAYDELREYRNPETGETRQIPFVGGQPIYPIPEGFVYQDPEKVVTEEVTTTPTTGVGAPTARVAEGDDEPKDDGFGPGGGRVALGGFNQNGKRIDSTLAGVSFSNMGTVPGMAGTVMGAFNLLTGKPIPDDATATFTRDNVTVNVTGSEYNELKGTKFVGAKAETVAQALSVRAQAKKGTLQVDEATGDIKDENGNDVSNDVISRIGQTVYDNVKSTSFEDMAAAGRKLSPQEKAIVSKYNDSLFEDFFADEPEPAPAPEPQRDDNNDDRPSGGGTSISDIISSAPTSSSNEDYIREAFGFNEGGDVTKQMEKSGLTPKK